MAYIRNIPLSTDLIANSQPQLNGNFLAIDSGTTGTGIGFSRNHVTITDATNGGLHNRVDYFVSVSDPTLSGFISSLYPKAVNAISELFYKNGTRTTQLTGPISLATSGYSFLPGGLLIKWGSFSGSSGNNTFTFPTGGGQPAFSSIFQVFLQPSGAGGSPNYFAYINSIGTTSFSYDSVARTSNTGATGTYSYYAIGAA